MILQKVILEMGSIRGYVVDPLTSTNDGSYLESVWLWRISGGLLTGDDVVGFRIYSLKVTPLRLVVIGEVALSQEEPLSVDLTMFPEAPIPTKVLFPNTTP